LGNNTRVRVRATLVVVGVALTLVGCSRTEEISALCLRSPELESSLVAVNEGLGNLGGTPSAVLQSSFAVLLDTLGVMLELPPPDARGNLETVDRAYREVYVAMRNVYWDPSLAATDANVSRSVENLSRNDNVRALDDLNDFIEEWCAREIDATVPLVAGDATTLPAPVPVVEPLDEYEYLFDDEPSAMASYGYLVASARSVSLTEEQARCVGQSVTEAAQLTVFDDPGFEAVVTLAFRECGVAGFAPTSTTTTTG
jgi:hypothetical protein